MESLIASFLLMQESHLKDFIAELRADLEKNTYENLDEGDIWVWYVESF